MKPPYKSIAISALGLGFVSLIIFAFLFYLESLPYNFLPPLNTGKLDHFGSLIGGLVGALFSLASILLLIHTIKEQELDSLQQKIESRFFELLKIHLDNYSQIRLSSKVGRYAVARMLREYRVCFKLTKETAHELNMKYDENDILNFAYLAFYFGCFEKENSTNQQHTSNPIPRLSDQATTFRAHTTNYAPAFVNAFITKVSQNREEIKKEGRFNHKLFAGHQVRLSQYFRHLFQTVRYINEQKHIPYSTKYEYIKTLRAQLSPQEQLLLFANSKSTLGYEWDINHPNDPNKQLITKYNLIKNIIWAGEALEKHYSNVEYENKPMPPGREALMAKYQ